LKLKSGQLNSAYQRWAAWIGAQPAQRVIWVLAFLFSCWILLDIFNLRVTNGLASSAFDTMVRARVYTHAPDPRIVIVDIDESSLQRMSAEFGRWPWPRDTLATVLDHIEKQKPAAIVWDVLFSDADQISPGGDAAFDAAVSRSAHSHFAVVRLRESSDAQSQIARPVLPTLWATSGTPSPTNAGSTAATVAMIPPALAAVSRAPLGYNNGYVDGDGVLRHYRYFETLRDGSVIQSLPMSVLSSLDPAAYQHEIANISKWWSNRDELVDWRRHANLYPHYPIADVFDSADSGQSKPGLPSFAGKIVIIGATAASLHDIHPTPLAADQAGVDTLATAIDNTVNHHHLYELPRWLHALVAIALCIGLAAWVQHRKLTSLASIRFVLPVGLLFISYLTLNISPVFVDLQLSAALALIWLSLLKFWHQMQRDFWCMPAPPLSDGTPMAIWPLVRTKPWDEEALDRLIDFTQQHLPQCRLVAPQVEIQLFQSIRWPELTLYAAIVGPAGQLQWARDNCQTRLARLCRTDSEIAILSGDNSRQSIARTAMRLWAKIGSE